MIPTEGDCIICRRQAPINRKGQCHWCWLDRSGWTPPEDLLASPQIRSKGNEETTRRAIRHLMSETEDAVIKGRWKPTPPLAAGIYHEPTDRIEVQRARPWRRYRYEPARTDPNRLANGVSLPCLVCLRVRVLRLDQVCDLCERNWTEKAGEPKGEDYDWWVIKRRWWLMKKQDYKNKDHLPAYDRAVSLWKAGGEGPYIETLPLTRDRTRVPSRRCYNKGAEFAKFQQAADRYPWHRRLVFFYQWLYQLRPIIDPLEDPMGPATTEITVIAKATGTPSQVAALPWIQEALAANPITAGELTDEMADILQLRRPS